jgi:flagellar basal body rod protein FlgG
MQRIFMLFGFAVLILGAGLLAGQRVQSSQESDSALRDPGVTNQARTDSACENAQTACALPIQCATDGTAVDSEALHVPQVDSLIMPVSHQRTVEEDFPIASVSENTASVNVQKTEAIRSLIQRSFPDASGETVNVWTEVYAAMDPAEVEFILDQKRAFSGALDSQIPGIMISPGSASPGRLVGGSDTSVGSASTMTRAVEIIRQNLNNAWSVGFRRTVVLPRASVVGKSDSAMDTAKFSPTMFTDFDSGRLISSPMPLHVAIQEHPTWMFRLDGDMLTRRGDFELLPDRRIGLMVSGNTHALANSPTLPEDARRPSINAAGGIEYTDQSGAMIQAGQLEIVKVTELDQLASADGIHFTSRSLKTLEPVTVEDCFVAVGSLELSNVDREEEAALLNHFRTERENP